MCIPEINSSNTIKYLFHLHCLKANLYKNIHPLKINTFPYVFLPLNLIILHIFVLRTQNSIL